MSNSKKKWWLALVVICCLAPATFADQGQYQKPDRDHYPGRHGCEPQDDGCRPQPVPEGGSTAIYLLGAGLTCFGAMFLRSKQGRPTQ
ncbi:MAG: hypothetical protein WBQ43_24760 [Terriglobales bacterium]